MRRIVYFAFTPAILAMAFTHSAFADDNNWATIKGQVVFPANKQIPKREPLKVNQDKDHCLKNGDILDESVIVNPKNRGIKNVVVFLRPEDTKKTDFPKDKIHPEDAKRKSAEVVIDQPCCMFVNRITVARVGDTLVVKNPAPVAHNFRWTTENNGDYNQNIPKQDQWKLPDPLAKELTPIQYSCTIHSWMAGYVRIFDHPYYAVTDDNGNFQIKNAPTGKFRIVYWHENGVRGGREGRFGELIEIKGPVMEIKPIEFDVSPK